MAAPSKQYGLIFPKKAQQKTFIKHSVFMDDSDEETSVGESLQREALKKQAMKQTKLEIQRALAEDSTVYEYDNIYEDIQQKKAESHPGSLLGKEEKKPKYIQSILKAAELRKKEQEKRMEKKIQKEREMEGGAFDDKESFVTSAYKKKLQERAEEEEREKREAALEACLDVTKQKDLSGFYRHLLNQSVGEEEVPQCSLREARIKEEKPSDSRQTSRSPEVKRGSHIPLRGDSSLDADSEVETASSDGEHSAKAHTDSRKEAQQSESDPSKEGSRPYKSQRDSRSCSEERAGHSKVPATHSEREEGGGSRKERRGQPRERDLERRQRDNDKEEHLRSEEHYRRQEERESKQRKKDKKEKGEYDRESRKEKHLHWQEQGKEGLISNKDHGKDWEREDRDKGAKIRGPRDEKEEKHLRERKNSSPQSLVEADHQALEKERGGKQPSDSERVSEQKHKSAAEETEQAEKPVASQNKFAKRSNEETVMSARDRYLARQMARVGPKAYIEKEED
ncbi:nuclear speckle splicing regulatory protein 1 [Heteronotia binoei]|uniref:nuclear speckle splicing regulatory protein 1 n=1 Tax=Heteronotia binoei TaxID=13085 RepID=UPI00292FA9F8|nr:nuclear speckle splicing regulatory protein 1 [Heteronotia binoei]